MRKKIDYKKNQVQLKKRDNPTKLINRGNLGYPGKLVNHANLI
jgi:hypothetical protein